MFHQALEEKSIVAAMVTARPYLAHVQLGDSNRLAPGQGFLPWRDIVETLRALKYDAWLSMEFTQKPDSPTCAEQAMESARRELVSTEDVRGYPMPPERSHDIDTPLDMEFARFLVERGHAR